MSGGRVGITAVLLARELSRRRLAVGLLLVLPLVLYLSLLAARQYALFTGMIGIAWSIASVSMFSILSAREIEPRLILAGFRATELLLGRLLLFGSFGLLVVGSFGVVMEIISEPPQLPAFWLGLGLVVLIAVPLGLAIGAVVPRELEGTLVVIGVIGVEMSLPRGALVAPLLPLYGPTQLARVATGEETGPLLPSLVHGIAYALLLLLVAIVFWTWRTRVRRTTRQF